MASSKPTFDGGRDRTSNYAKLRRNDPPRRAARVEKDVRAIPTPSKRAPDPFDVYVGSRVRMTRQTLGMSQTDLGKALDLTFQQIQKYEKGSNRLSSSRLQMISNITGVPVSFFFEGGPNIFTSMPDQSHSMDYIAKFVASSDGLALVRAYSKIKDSRLKRRLIDLIEAMTVDDPGIWRGCSLNVSACSVAMLRPSCRVRCCFDSRPVRSSISDRLNGVVARDHSLSGRCSHPPPFVSVFFLGSSTGRSAHQPIHAGTKGVPACEWSALRSMEGDEISSCFHHLHLGHLHLGHHHPGHHHPCYLDRRRHRLAAWRHRHRHDDLG